jgi:hypothetical protein
MRPNAAAATDDLSTFITPLGRELRVLIAAYPPVESPPGFAVVAEIRIDAGRQIGEIPEWVGRFAYRIGWVYAKK